MCEIDYGYLQMMRNGVMLAEKEKYNVKACPFGCNYCKKTKEKFLLHTQSVLPTQTTIDSVSSVPVDTINKNKEKKFAVLPKQLSIIQE